MSEAKHKGVFILCATFNEDHCDPQLWLPDAHFATMKATIAYLYKYITTEWMSAKNVREAIRDATDMDEKLKCVLDYMFKHDKTYVDYQIQFLSLA
jgi:hypothetical protein